MNRKMLCCQNIRYIQWVYLGYRETPMTSVITKKGPLQTDKHKGHGWKSVVDMTQGDCPYQM